MKLVAVSVGRPREMAWEGAMVRTSIFKSPVEGRVRVTRLNIEGDAQGDLDVHGGTEMAAYAYPAEHYAYWRGELPGVDLPWGVFGENLSIEGGLLEDAVGPGDRLSIGTAQFKVTEPRMPCYKLALRLNRADIVKRFMKSGRTGFYLSVLREGEIGAGDEVTFERGAGSRPSIAAIVAAKSRRTPGL